VRSCNHCCSVKAVNITYNVHVSVALVVQHAMWMHYIVICGLQCSTSFFVQRITCICWGGGNIDLKMCVDFLCKFCVKYFLLNEVLRERWSKKYVVLHVKYLLLWYFNENWIFHQFFKKSLKMKFHENPSSESRIVPCQWIDGLMDRHVEANSRFLQCCKCA